MFMRILQETQHSEFVNSKDTVKEGEFSFSYKLLKGHKVEAAWRELFYLFGKVSHRYELRSIKFVKNSGRFYVEGVVKDD